MADLAADELQRFAPGRPAALTIGNFDGVHLGHQHLVQYVIKRARELGLAAGAVTLYPDPVKVLRPDEPMQYLTSLEERLELLKGLGLDFVAPISFTPELSVLAPEAFAALLREKLDMSLLVMGPDHSFGRRREGTPQRMQQAGAEMGFTVEVLPQALLDASGTVSATAIRRALTDGDIDLAARLLGRRYAISGPVVSGDRRGKQLGFPTANVAVTADRALPAFGVYATWLYRGERRYASATNIGLRPTFEGRQATVETFIFDFDEDIYGEAVRVELVERLRPEMSFGNIDDLKAQMAHDVEQARGVLSAIGV